MKNTMSIDNKTECCGWCDTKVCHNTDCPKWQKKDAEEMKKYLFDLVTSEWDYLND